MLSHFNITRQWFLAAAVWISWVCALAGRCHAESELTVLVSFNSTNGAIPEATLVQGSDGDLYGTSIYGGSNDVAQGGDGTAFRVSTEGVFITQTSLDRGRTSAPQAGLVEGTDGNFYGTGNFGGPGNLGAVFRVSKTGVFSIVHPFLWPEAEYANGLVEDAPGSFLGTAYYGGTNGGSGSIFRVDTNGLFFLLSSFNGTNGANPQAPLLRGRDGNFYGTTVAGGTNGGFGTVYLMTPDGAITSLFSFNGTNGASPLGGLFQDLDGTLYGTTFAGGPNIAGSASSGNGSIFKVTTNGQLTTLHFFAGYPLDGTQPGFGSLCRGPDGAFYGTTQEGGANAYGTIFRMTSDGTVSLLYSFTRPDPETGTNVDGCEPSAGLLLASDGNFYGVTMRGGANGVGTLFRFNIAPKPPLLRAHESADGAILLDWDAVIGARYQLQYCASLPPESWIDFREVITADQLTVTVSDSINATQPRFYRLAVLP